MSLDEGVGDVAAGFVGAWLAVYMLPFGGWGRPKPSDLDNPADAVLLPILGWLLLLVLAVLAR